MSIKIEARADVRALAGGLFLGAVVGVALGGVYLAGGAAGQADAKARAQHFASAAAQGFSDEALREQAAQMTPGELALAERHDPLAGNSGAQRDRLAAAFANQLMQREDVPSAQPTNLSAANLKASGNLLRASFSAPTNPQAQPFHMSGALDSARDLDCLADAVYYEARGETPAGQAAVAQVVLNRVRHPAFPKSVCGVVFQGARDGTGCQFSFACDGSTGRTRISWAWDRAQAIARSALNGGVMPAVGNATHYHTQWVAPYWSPGLTKIGQIGAHIFYRWAGDAGLPQAFRGRYAGGEVSPHDVSAKIETPPSDVANATAAVVAIDKPFTIAKAAPVASIALATPAKDKEIDDTLPSLQLTASTPAARDQNRPRTALPSGW